jgi:hypothetical protein
MSHEGAREVLLFGTDFAYWADFPDPSIPSTARPQVSKSAFGYVGAWNDNNKDNATFNILIDTGASVNISGHASDLLADYPASCLCNQDLPSMDSTDPLPQTALASFYGTLSMMTVPFVLFAALVIMFPVPQCDYSAHKIFSANTKPADSLLTPTG